MGFGFAPGAEVDFNKCFGALFYAEASEMTLI
jgi:hypothetical protein